MAVSCSPRLEEEEDVGEDDEEVEGEPRDGEDEADQRQDERHAAVPLQLTLAPPLVRLKARVLPAIGMRVVSFSWFLDVSLETYLVPAH